MVKIRKEYFMVKDFIEEFPPDTAKLIDYEFKLKRIEESFILFEHAVNDLLVVIAGTDDTRKTQLETSKNILLAEVKEHETKVVDKVKEMKDAQPNAVNEKI